jgi:hypothetical protein
LWEFLQGWITHRPKTRKSAALLLAPLPPASGRRPRRPLQAPRSIHCPPALAAQRTRNTRDQLHVVKFATHSHFLTLSVWRAEEEGQVRGKQRVRHVSRERVLRFSCSAHIYLTHSRREVLGCNCRWAGVAVYPSGEYSGIYSNTVPTPDPASQSGSALAASQCGLVHVELSLSKSKRDLWFTAHKARHFAPCIDI